MSVSFGTEITSMRVGVVEENVRHRVRTDRQLYIYYDAKK